jgi:hypothetical protein
MVHEVAVVQISVRVLRFSAIIVIQPMLFLLVLNFFYLLILSHRIPGVANQKILLDLTCMKHVIYLINFLHTSKSACFPEHFFRRFCYVLPSK